MKKLSIKNMEETTGGDAGTSACAGAATAGVIYTVGAIAAVNWWNPVGWVTGVFVAATVACGAYAYANQD